MSTPVSDASSRQPSAPSNGLRSRKKEKTRLAIQDAALELFAERGFDATTVDEIAERAEVSKATFFRYFGTKGEVIFGNEGFPHGKLQAAIEARPRSEDDLTAVRHALCEEWVPALDPVRILRQARAAATSPLLRGLSNDLGVKWQGVISEALARRRGLDAPDQRCWLVAAMANGVFSNVVNSWSREVGPGDLVGAIDHGFELLIELCADVHASSGA